jgi:hypothetical protein
MENLGKISAFGKNISYAFSRSVDLRAVQDWVQGRDMLTWLLQRFFHTLGCQDAAVCQGASRQCRGQGAATLSGSLPCRDEAPWQPTKAILIQAVTDSTPPGLHRAREARRCAEEGAHNHAAGDVRHPLPRPSAWPG